MEINELDSNGTIVRVINAANTNLSNVDEVRQLSREIDSHNVVLLRGLPIANDQDFCQFSISAGDHFQPYVGGAFERKSVNGNKTVLEVSGGKTSLVPLHGEMYYMKNKPSRLWLYCQTAPSEGGETQVCDSHNFYQHLSPSTKALLEENNISYYISYEDDSWKSMHQCTDLEAFRQQCKQEGMEVLEGDDGSIKTRYTVSPLVKNTQGDTAFMNNIIPILGQEYVLGSSNRIVRFENGDKIPMQVFGEFVQVTNEIAYAHPWKSNDILVVNNKNTLHGRTQIVDQRRNIMVRLGYEEVLDSG